VIDRQDLAAGAVERQFLPAQLEHADLRVAQPHRASGQRGDVVPGPQPPERFAGQRQLADQLDDPRVVDVAAHGCAEPGDHAPDRLFPVRVEIPLDGVEEDRTQPVDTWPDVR
jgi:hypothetical protein